jgi:RNA polymerase sigma factor (sigma-70 family)
MLLPADDTPGATGATDSAALAARARDGDEDAARRLFARLHPLVSRIVRAHRPRRSSPEDLVQMTLIKVFTRLHQYGGEVPLEHWVSRITVNTCVNQLRAERARPELRWADLGPEQAALLAEGGADEGGAGPGRALAARELVGLLLEALAPADRMAVTLFYLEHRSVADIARLTGAGRVSVRVRLMRARRRMEKLLRRLQEEDRP